jgi:hypothetical protein
MEARYLYDEEGGDTVDAYQPLMSDLCRACSFLLLDMLQCGWVGRVEGQLHGLLLARKPKGTACLVLLLLLGGGGG